MKEQTKTHFNYMKKFSKKIMKVNIYHSCNVNCIFRKPQFALTKKKYFRVKKPQNLKQLQYFFRSKNLKTLGLLKEFLGTTRVKQDNDDNNVSCSDRELEQVKDENKQNVAKVLDEKRPM